MRFLNTDKLRTPTNGHYTDCACATTCFDRNRFKDCCGLLTLFSNITLKLIFAFVTVSVSVSSAYSQSEDLRLTCSFVKRENPVEKEGFIWKKEVITVEYEFVNVSGENLMIPDPNRYSPFEFMFTTSDGDTLGFDAKIYGNALGIFRDHTFLEINKGGSTKFKINIVNDTRITRTKDRMGLSEIEGIKYPFKTGKVYQVHSRYRSELGGAVEVNGTPYRIWNGEISCDNVLEFTYR